MFREAVHQARVNRTRPAVLTRSKRKVCASFLAGPVMILMEPIGIVRTPYTETAQIPKGLGAEHRAEGILDVLPPYEAGLTDIEGFSHLYVLWVFDRAASGCALVGTPPSDNRPHGVFATRSPRRPNPIGLTVVRLLWRDGCKLYVRGVDMLDGTPILDIKPYLSSIPAEELCRGWLAEAEARRQSR
jgi:tRNA (adenine37-N6)-methyltransferase